MNELIIINKEEIFDIANTIREKTGQTELMTFSEITNGIKDLSNSESDPLMQLIKQKLIELNLVTESANLENCASVIQNIENIGEINLLIDNERTEVYEIPAGYTNGGEIIVTAVTHYYYNDLKLPKIPSDAYIDYPYCWIRDNSQTGYYDLIMGTTSFYYDQPNSRLRRRGNDTDLWYRIQKSTASTATSWGSPQSHTYVGWSLGSDRIAIWSNYDVTQSETSSEIYLKGTDPEPDVSGQELMNMIEEVL